MLGGLLQNFRKIKIVFVYSSMLLGSLWNVFHQIIFRHVRVKHDWQMMIWVLTPLMRVYSIWIHAE